jgi:hypothetical protein
LSKCASKDEIAFGTNMFILRVKKRRAASVEMRSGDTICDYKACSHHVRRLLRAPNDSTITHQNNEVVRIMTRIRSLSWKTWRKARLTGLQLAERDLTPNSAGAIAIISAYSSQETLGRAAPSYQITRFTDIMLLRRAQILQ